MLRVIGKKTKVFTRFSTVGGEKGSADTERDPRGFAVKFYTEDGNWDLVGNNTPVFFIKDPKKFPDFIHTQKRDPYTNCKSPTMMWDYWSLNPESLHQVLILMSDRGTPVGYRFMNGYGSHTFSLTNDKNQRVYVKFHYKTMQGIKTFTDAEAAELKSKDPDFSQRDLVEAIDNGHFPKYALKIQVMTFEQAKTFEWNPFDLTKVWPHADYPLIDVGVMELNRNPDNYFAEVEQAAFNPSNVVPGISFSPDKMLQGRLFSYGDAQRYRLGVNHVHIPVNQPKCPVNSYHRDGAMRVDGNFGSTKGYEPNSLGLWQEQAAYQEPQLALSGAAYNWDFREDDSDYYSQPAQLFNLMSADQQQVLFENTARSIGPASNEVKHRHITNCYKADPAYGKGVADALAIDLSDLDL